MLIQILLLFSFVAIACVLCNKLTNRVGIPMLLAFLGVGMLCGTDGLLGISFENDAICEQVSTVALIFIIFMVASAPNGVKQNRLPVVRCCCLPLESF